MSHQVDVLLIRDEALEQLVKDLEGYLKSIKDISQKNSTT
jgi:hypothetical protein